MKKIVFVACTLLILAGCGGNNLDLDEKKMKQAVVEQALERHDIREGGYEASDIEVNSICEAERKSEKDVPQHYFVHWETNDGEIYEKNTVMKKYEKDGAADFYEKTEECINY
ncbi:hypothetical protein [Thalassobacillus sp. B23F22_16]|uniref:hypothetical protein n=1 Tax=Thalassobacillus sp. B23F22_16 TaxID=3459513 RepID=UPI00373F52EB